MMVVSAFLVYSELESAGEMFFMLPMIDASIDRVEEIDRAPRMDEGGSVQVPKSHDISFDHVDFSYGDRKIIDDVSFTIPEGTTTAIVGPSGSGKTTLTSLMARFWDVKKGSVKLGGIDVKDYSLDSLMSNFSMVFRMCICSTTVLKITSSLVSRRRAMKKWWLRQKLPAAMILLWRCLMAMTQ